ncbi:SDR family NAD(P)-dependent oxidoreductase [Streptomyces antimycoticus]|uniref:SDR family NAD(P)-dependent oxidoreductase n=1 Tax=Streptomyces antimycoticus TaxID=68175 RepID=UPI003865A38F|nr:SDR family NAD(P)-dependent oxidoreductase [Streptomyces antimycoticus]
MSQHTPAPSRSPGRIAIVGLGCRLPGDIDSSAALWRLLADGRDAVAEPPAERAALWAADPITAARPESAPPVRGGHLRDVSGFDADVFGVSGREADILDPQHRLLLEVAWEALEHAGMPPDRLGSTATGVFAGLSYNDYMNRLDRHPRELEGSALANGHCVATGRISYLLGLHRPSVALDTACSSSPVAVHLAVQALRAGECDLALAGGVTLMFEPRITRSFDRMGMLSHTGHCHAFDASADGFVRGEGCGLVVLKRLTDAVRDGDRILAVLRGSAVNQDGHSDGLAAPSATAQRALYEEALGRAGVDPADVGMVEAHGTGTPVGDPVEFAGLAQVYGTGRDRCALASVKINLGHLEPSAGVTGLIKAVLCLGRGLIPPNPHFTRWNPTIDADGTRFFIPRELTPWPVRTGPRLAAVSSFGFSGTNAHVVLEQPPAAPAPTSRTAPRPRPAIRTGPQMFLVPAGSPAAPPDAAPPDDPPPDDPPGASPAGALPGAHLEVPGDPVRHSWRARTGTAALPWLDDHRVHDVPVLPGAASYALALTAACEVFGAEPEEVEITDLHFRELLRLADRADLSTTVTLAAADRAECEIFGRGEDGAWVRQATAVLRRLAAPQRPRAASVQTLALRHPLPVEADALYANLRARGVAHGPAFQGITEVSASRHNNSFWARVRIPEAARAPGHGLRIHPVLVDLCAQLLVAGLPDEDDRLLLPARMQSVRVLGDPGTAVYCHARLAETAPGATVGHVRLLDAAGRPVLAVDGLRIVHRAADRTAEADQWFLEVGWRRATRPAAIRRPGRWLIVGEADGTARPVAAALRNAGATARVWEAPLADQGLDAFRDALTSRLTRPGERPRAVVLLCGPRPADGGAEDGLRRTRRLLAAAQALTARFPEPPRLYAATCGARTVTPGDLADPGQSPLRGLVRVLALEHPELRATLVDTDSAAPDELAETLAAELLADGPEEEIALRDSARYTAELDYAPLTDTERTTACARTVRCGTDGFRLRAGRLGDLGSLELTTTPRPRPGPGEVELRVLAAGLNFRDVLTAMGQLPGDENTRYRLGFECAGEVSAVGPGVDHLRAGDRVVAADALGGAFGSFTVVPADRTAPLPEGLAPDTAAGLPIAFLTAWYALRHVGQVTAGERVLIHSATGGTGLAAIAVARLLGAEVLATAGSEEKRRFLRAMGVAHVMDSRSLDFRDEVKEATGGEGVDVVLNSLAGSAIRAGLECLRPFGRFVELGVRDILSDAPLGLSPLRHNITFSTVDLRELQLARPRVYAAMLREVLAAIGEGRLKPLRCTTYPLAEVIDAFRRMAGARHIGKLVLTIPQEGELDAVLPDGPLTVREGGTYIVTGGLRGLGVATACWLARQGAGHLVLSGRTAPAGAAARTLGELSAAGTRITVVTGDISLPGTADRLVAAATAPEGASLNGVVHSAMVLDDAAVATIREDQLGRVWAPKVTGAWRLHRATEGHRLDWFAVYSSMASLLGNAGQGAYAAANAWLDGFAAWRSARGLPTLAVNWGPWGETGVATGFADRGCQTIPTEQGLGALGALLAHRRVQTGVIPGEPATWIPAAARRSALFAPLLPGDDTPVAARESAGDIRARLAALPAGPARRAALESCLTDHIRAVLRLSSATLDPRTPLRSLGFDSLLAMELRVRLETGLNLKLAGNFVWRHPTLEALAAGLAQQLGLDPADRPEERLGAPG